MRLNKSFGVISFLTCLILSVSSTTLSAQGFAWVHGIISTPGGNNGVNASTTDVSNNGYFVGSFNGTTDFDPGPAVHSLTAVGGLNMFILKNDASGNFLWVKHVSGISPNMYGCFPHDIRLDNFGNIYVAGNYRDSFDFDPGPSIYKLSSLGGYHSFVLKLNPAGDFLWVKDMGSQTAVASMQLLCMKLDAAGNIYFASSIGGTATPTTIDVDPGPGVYNVLCPAAGAGSQDVLLQKLDSAGNFIWAKQISGSGDKDAWSLAIDKFYDVYITGQFMGTADFDPGPLTANLSSTGGYDIFIAKYDSAGSYQWAKRIGSPAGGEDVGYGIATDTFGNILVTGYFATGTVDFDPGPGVYHMTAASRDMFILRLRNNGNFSWARSIHPGGNDFGGAITTDGQGNIYTAGWTSGGVDSDPGPGVYIVGPGAYVQKLDSSANFLWARAFGGDDPESIALDYSNDIYVTGSFTGSGDFDPGPGVLTLTTFNGGFIEKLCGTGLSIAASDSTICAGASSQLSTPAITGATYVWTLDGNPITGNTNTVNVTQAGAYEVFVNGGCPSASGPVYISVLPTIKPTINISGPLGELVGQPVTVNATVANAGPSYSIDWRNNGISFATTTVPSVTYTKQANSDIITAFVTSTSPGCFDSTLSNTHSVYDATGIIETMKSEGIEVYPNPFRELITVKGLKMKDRISLVEITGRIVQTWQSTEPTQVFKLQNISAGFYVLRIMNEKGEIRVNVPVVKH